MSGKDLYNASKKGDLTEAKRLLDSGADINWEDWNGGYNVWDILYYFLYHIIQ